MRKHGEVGRRGGKYLASPAASIGVGALPSLACAREGGYMDSGTQRGNKIEVRENSS